MKGKTLRGLPTGGGSVVVANITRSALATWLRVLKVGRLNTGDAYLDAVPAPKRSIAIVHFYNFTDEGWR